MRFFNRHTDLSDHELMAKICKGDHKAFSIIFDRYQQKISNYFYKMLWNDYNMAQDFTQEIFTKIINKPELYNQDYKFSSWLFSIASNMCKNAYRKRSYELAYIEQLPKFRFENDHVDIRLDNEKKMIELNKVLENLEKDKKHLFLLRYQQELSIKEIATIMDCSEGTIKSRLFYIRKYILEVFQEQLIID